jgi:four helix bundle protein
VTIQSYRDLRVWQEAMLLAECVYGLTRQFPKDEMFGLTSQARRSAVSVAANIAEGYGRENTGSYIQFLRIGQGSLKELETHLILAARIGLAPKAVLDPALDKAETVGKMLRALIRSLETPP